MRRLRPFRPLLLLLIAVASPARADLPPGHVMLTLGQTVDDRDLPPLLVLPGGSYSTIGLGIPLAIVPHQADDLVIYDANDSSITAVPIGQFVSPASEAWYFDPVTKRTLRALVTGGGAGGTSFFVQDLGAKTLAELLQPPGSVLVYRAVPEPAQVLLLLSGCALLWALQRGRSRGRAM